MRKICLIRKITAKSYTALLGKMFINGKLPQTSLLKA